MDNKINDWAGVDLNCPGGMVAEDGVYLINREYGCPVTGSGQWGLGVCHLTPSAIRLHDWWKSVLRFDSEEEADSFVREHAGIALGRPLREKYIVLHGLPDLASHPVWSDPARHWSVYEKTGDSGYGPLPGSFS